MVASIAFASLIVVIWVAIVAVTCLRIAATNRRISRDELNQRHHQREFFRDFRF